MSLTCTKQDVTSVNPCDLGITFARDSTRLILVKSYFTGLPDGIVFHPSFTILAESDSNGPSAEPIGPVYFGQEVTLAYKLTRALRRTDKLAYYARYGDSYGSLRFVRSEPSVAEAPRLTNGDDDHNRPPTPIYIPLDTLDTDKVTADNFRMVFRHIPRSYSDKPVSEEIELTTLLNGYDAVPKTNLFSAESPVRITKVPSAKSTLYYVLGIEHPDMAAGDSFLLNDSTYSADAAPELRCDGLDTPIAAVNNQFTLTTAVPANNPCYAVLKSHVLATKEWSVTATIAGVSMTVFYAAAWRPSAVPELMGFALFKDVEGEQNLNIPDFTTELADASSRTISFGYKPIEVEFTAIKCSSTVGETDATTFIDSKNGDVQIKFRRTSVPLAHYGELQCIMTLKPLAAVSNPKMTNVKILDKVIGDMDLPRFNEPRISLSLPKATVNQGERGIMNAQLKIEGVESVIGAKVTLNSDVIPVSAIDLKCGGTSYKDGVLTLKESRSENNYHCDFTALYLSDKPVPLTVTFVKDVFVTSETLAPASIKRKQLRVTKSHVQSTQSPIERLKLYRKDKP